MVVQPTTAVDAASQLPRTGPTRTCIGCRKRSATAELLRVVAVSSSAGTADQSDQRSRSAPADRRAAVVRVVPDPRRRATGRGAWLHPDPACAALAQRRRAFARALRVSGEADPSAVLEHVAEHSSADRSA
ncbi:MAG: DUF448 domain-containing protein [Actinomycetia bacterium]|nr:DUF448 domain-containing protein [Actinomycetes bacterium]